MNDTTTRICSFLTSSSHTTARSARRRVCPPTRFTWADFHVTLRRFSNAPESRDPRVWAVTAWPTATWLQADSSARTCIVRKHHALTVSRVNRRNSALANALRPVPKFAVGGWAWVHNSASTIRQGVKANTDAKVLKTKLALNWTRPYKVLASWSLLLCRHPGRLAARRQPPLFRSPFRPARF